MQGMIKDSMTHRYIHVPISSISFLFETSRIVFVCINSSKYEQQNTITQVVELVMVLILVKELYEVGLISLYLRLITKKGFLMKVKVGNDQCRVGSYFPNRRPLSYQSLTKI